MPSAGIGRSQLERVAGTPFAASGGMPRRLGVLPSQQTALLLIDVVNPFDFPGAGRLLRHAAPVASRLAALKRRAAAAEVPSIYVNDNFGDWHNGFGHLVDRYRDPSAPGREFVARLAPEPRDYHVLKPRHSGFLSTSLDALLDRLGARTVVLTGVAAHICVLFTAIDAYMRGLEIVVASDCVAAEEPRQVRYALTQMREILKARVAPARSLRFGRRAPRRRPSRLAAAMR
jgi:nicotinamidase-related amidase